MVSTAESGDSGVVPPSSSVGTTSLPKTIPRNSELAEDDPYAKHSKAGASGLASRSVSSVRPIANSHPFQRMTRMSSSQRVSRRTSRPPLSREASFIWASWRFLKRWSRSLARSRVRVSPGVVDPKIFWIGLGKRGAL